MENKKIVIALGGNALGNDVEEQKEAVAKTAEVIVDLAQQGYHLIVTHGNGPQVGMIQTAMDNFDKDLAASKKVPLPTSVAMSQGYIGIDLQNAIKYELYKRDLDMKVSTILSQVEVDENDEAFAHPTKPIGRFMTEEEAKEKEAEGIHCMEDAGRGYRVAVASPMPKRIRELETIRTLMEAGHIVITCGGGGIPVIPQEHALKGASAVIEKDCIAGKLAVDLKADQLIILTSVKQVYKDYQKETEAPIRRMNTAEAKAYIADGQFEAGTMLPKIEAAISYLEAVPTGSVLITSLDFVADAVKGKAGTVITS